MYLNENPLALLIMLFISIVGILYFRNKIKCMKAAVQIVKTQHELAPKHILEQGYEEFTGDILERYKAIVIRIRAQYGHENVKVGHVAWLIQAIHDPSIDISTVNIPSFIKEL
jgi:hypothetical protein